jgi:AcrR family transcriptional regulator
LKPTKQHIKDHALKLFNEKGFVNVRLQHIADAAFVSVGHLAYHFKNKDAIIEDLYEELRRNQEDLLNKYRVVPLFEDINSYLVASYLQQTAHMFFYADMLEVLRAFPGIQARHSRHLMWQSAQIKMMIAFNCARGSMIVLTDKQQDYLAWQLRSLIDMWHYIKKTEGKKDLAVQHFLDDIWGVLNPFFTDMGTREFLQLNADV